MILSTLPRASGIVRHARIFCTFYAIHNRVKFKAGHNEGLAAYSGALKAGVDGSVAPFGQGGHAVNTFFFGAVDLPIRRTEIQRRAQAARGGPCAVSCSKRGQL